MAMEEIEELLARVAMGDRGAFTRLYDLTSAKLLGVSLRILKNRATAEDAMQETFIKIWHKADTYAVNGLSPMTWMITIARNTAIDRLRAERDAVDIDDVAGGLAAKGPTPEQSAVASGEAARITACLDELEDDRRAAVRGAYLAGDSYAELAKRFEVPINTMRSWLRRSLIALRECMAR